MYNFAKNKRGGMTPIAIVLSVAAAIIILGGVAAAVYYFSPSDSNKLQLSKCGDGVCGIAERTSGKCPTDCVAEGGVTRGDTKQGSVERPVSGETDTPSGAVLSTGDNSLDADGIFWGTEVYPDKLASTENIIKDSLRVKNLKVRVQMDFFTKNSDGKSWSPVVCLPSPKNCKVTYNLDEKVALFKQNGWSMRPMISLLSQGSGAEAAKATRGAVTTAELDDYVNFVDWFVARYKKDANIKAIELFNAPVVLIDQGILTNAQLVTVQNLTYDRLKSKHPEVLVGSHGFEFQFDTSIGVIAGATIDYFLDKSHGAKFDYFAFHGYPSGSAIATAKVNKYAGIPGLLEIRKKLDAGGWQNVPMVDTEHTSISGMKSMLSDNDWKFDAAYMVQELVIKRTLKYNGNFVLSGITPLKIAAHSSFGEHAWASLMPDGSESPLVKATALLLGKLNEYRYIARVSGEFDNYDQVWVEKFSSANGKELYIFFKPLKIQLGKPIGTLDAEKASYTLQLNKKPTMLTLTDISGNVTNPATATSIALSAINAPRFLEAVY